MSTILETRGLTHVYGAGTPFERVALDHVDLKIEKGEILGVIGHTGSGKVYAHSAPERSLQPSEGEVLLDGNPSGMPKASAAAKPVSALVWCSSIRNTSCSRRPSRRTLPMARPT
ncbi:MAG: ATP-binding cassette domain-containing protein [Butyricicoccus sp.]